MKPKSVRFEHPGERVPDFCSLIRSRNLGRLSLSAFNHAFFDDGFPLPPSKKALSLRTPSISLAQVLTSPSLRNDNQCKLLLSYFLAKAVWQFYGSDWMTESWTKHTVHFMRQHLTKMQRRVQLYPKPFISADLGGSTPQPGPMPAKKQHIFPKILALGIMLLEIELGQDIENLHTEEVYDEGQLREGAEYFTAGRFLISEEWKARSKIFGPVKRVIEICITPNRSKLGTDPMEVRNKLYQVVVLPLRELFTYSWEYTPEDFQPEPIILAHMEHDTALTSYLDAAVSASSTPKPTRPSSNQSLSSSESQYPPPDSTPTDSSPVDLDRQYIHRDIPQITKQLFNLNVSVRSNYTIGWFCAISIELAAVCAMLDEVHDTPPMGPLQDIIYKFGRIGCHNVVIACLPAGSYGNISAAAVGKEMKLRFSGLRFGLMVGIGGGIPRDESGTSSASTDLHLGDVVVGIPTGDSGGVFQYDRGKTIDGGRFIHTGSLRKPPDILLSAVSNIQATPPQNLNEKLGQRVSEVQQVDCRLGYPGQKHDQLFHANYEHKEEGASCKLCDSTKLVNRRPRENHHPCVHYGVIASGGQVVRHGPTRDKIGRESRALCFEMEAAGLMDVLPCLIVRGISDYSDSHKSDLWQGYAAATAAAFTKELLLEIPALASS
ncbi:hypothetical protein TWF506_000009 [Arthrobotrys conoides]|uniref:DUF7580 domain-containing protein n=1 Tax=Arthrobotrys conoides TaxID=74498 RepID=A0AAN8NQ62_9PEZI